MAPEQRRLADGGGVPVAVRIADGGKGPDGAPALLPEDDRRWLASGAATYDEYVLWARNGCGTACFRIFLH